MEPQKSKLKPMELKIKPDFLRLGQNHPIRDLDTNILINHLESLIQNRDQLLKSRLKPMK